MSSQTTRPDRWARRTPASLQRALLELLQNDQVENITVSKLTHRADYARSTFYAHYRGLDDFVLHLLDDEARRHVSTGVRAMKPKEGQSRGEYVVQVKLPLLEYVAARKTLYRLTLSDALWTRARDMFCDRVTHHMTHRVHVIGDGQCNIDLAVHATVSEYVSVLKWWAEHDFEQSPRYMAEQFRYQHTDTTLWVARGVPLGQRQGQRTPALAPHRTSGAP